MYGTVCCGMRESWKCRTFLKIAHNFFPPFNLASLLVCSLQFKVNEPDFFPIIAIIYVFIIILKFITWRETETCITQFTIHDLQLLCVVSSSGFPTN